MSSTEFAWVLKHYVVILLTNCLITQIIEMHIRLLYFPDEALVECMEHYAFPMSM